MSLRAPFRALRTPIRQFATSTTHLAESSSGPSSSSSPASSSSGFAALRNVLSAPSAASSSAPLAATTSIPASALPARGYAPDSLPPKTDPLLDLFTNLLMKHGRKAEAQGRVSHILSLIQGATNSPPVPLLARAISLSSPSMRILSLRKRSKVVLTPLALDERQRTRQGIVWLLKASERGRKSGVPREQRVAREVLAILEGNSDVFKWLEERHKVGMANRSNLNARQ